MRTDELIADLAGRVTPVRPLSPPVVRALGWLLLATLCAGVGVTAFGVRPDLMVRLTHSGYVWLATLALLTSVFAAVVSLTQAIPGAERAPVLRSVTLGLLGLWAATTVRAVLVAGRGLPVSTDPHWPVCFLRVLLVAFLPALVLFWMVRRGTPLKPGWTAALAAAAAASVGVLAVHLACPVDDAGHGFLGHFVPLLLAGAAGIAVRRRLARSIAV
jgi:hypothetical protein